MSKFTIGTDPEFFLFDKNVEEVISAIPIIKGTKFKPQKMKCGSLLQHDNVLLEFATPPVSSCNDFVEIIRTTYKEAYSILPDSLEMLPIPSYSISERYLNSDEAHKFGCDVDYDAWKLVQNPTPVPPTPGFRTAGAHIHIGYVEGEDFKFLEDLYGKVDMVKALDLMLSVPLSRLDRSNSSLKRRQLYGKAGCHRPTSYGVEYRVPSNFWMQSPALVKLIYHLVEDTLNIFQNDKKWVERIIYNVGESSIQDTINEGIIRHALYPALKELDSKWDKETLQLYEQAIGSKTALLCRKKDVIKDNWDID